MSSLLIRRLHMYLALYLMPWIVIYALAAMAMNHREFFIDFYDGNLWYAEKESEQDYVPDVSPDASDAEIAEVILDHLGIPGPHNINRSGDGNQLNISRDDPLAARNIRYRFDEQKLTVDRFPFRPATLLVRLHHRHGYGREDAASKAWAVGVDVAVFGMLFWIGSGLWLWWKIRATRKWGIVCLVAGFGLFALFLVAI